MSNLIRQEEAMNMSNKQAVQILIPMRNMMCDQNGCPISDAVFALDKAIEVLSADIPQWKWIPVSERLPDAEYGEGDSVLCCTELGLIYILFWNGGNWCVPTGEPHQWVNHKTGWHDKVIAWMSLPEPYKGGE